MTGAITDAAARFSIALADRYRIERELGQGGMATVVESFFDVFRHKVPR